MISVKERFAAFDFTNTFQLLDNDEDSTILKEISSVDDIPDKLLLHQGFRFRCPEG